MDLDRLRHLAGTPAQVTENTDELAFAVENFMEQLFEQGHDPQDIRDALVAVVKDIESGVYDVDDGF